MKNFLLPLLAFVSFNLLSQTLIETSFDDYALGSIDAVSYWEVSDGGASVVNDAAYVHSGTQGLMLGSATATKLQTDHVAFDKSSTGITGQIYMDCWVKVITAPSSKSFSVRVYDLLPSGSRRACEFDITYDGELRVYNGGSKVSVGTSHYTVGDWIRLSASIDYEAASYEAAINGTVIGTYDFRESYSAVDKGRDTEVKEYHSLRFYHDADISSIAVDDVYVGTDAIADIAFSPPSVERSINVTQPEYGTITLDPQKGIYELGDTVVATISAIQEHYVFDGWTGSLSGNETPVTFTVEGNMTIGADVIIDVSNPPTSYNVTLTQTTGGTVTVSPQSGPYYEGAMLTFTATPDLAYEFTSWQGISGSSTTVELELSSDLTVSAIFTKGDFTPRTINVSSTSEFKAALQDLHAGDEVIMANGTYEGESSTIEDIKGTEEYPILIRAEEIGGVTFNDGFFIDFRHCEYITLQGFNINLNEMSTTLKVQASNHIRITQNVFDGIGEPAYKDGNTTDRSSSTWIILQGSWDDDVTLSHHNQIDHNVFKNKVTLGNMIRIDGTDQTYVSQYDVIEYNYFKNMGPRADNEMEAIRIGWSAMSESDGYCRVSNNLFEACNGDPEIISVKCNKNEILHNTFRACEGTLSLRHGNETLVEGNFFFGDDVDGTGGVRIYGSDHRIINNYFEGLKGTKWDAPITLTEGDAEEGSTGLTKHFRIERAIIANNTLINNDYGIEIGYDNNGTYSKPPRDVVMAYNIVQGSSNSLVNYINAPDDMTWLGNVMLAEGDATLGTNVTFSSTEVIEQDPQLVLDAGAGFYKATAATPTLTIDESAVGSISNDVEGQLRLATTNYGADEFSSASAIYYPLSSADVGPTVGDYLELSASSLSFERAGESQSLRISTNLSWTASTKAEWITLSESSGDGELAITISAAENLSENVRTATLSITSSGAELSKTVQIEQSATDPDQLTVSTNTLAFEAATATQNVEIRANKDWTAACIADWISLSPKTGSGNASLAVSVTENTSVTARSATLTVSIEGTLSEEISVYQSGVLGDEVKLNIISAVASVEQNEEGKVNIASNTLDGKYDTRWSGEGIGAYVDLTLNAVQRISYIKVGHYKGDERTSSFHVLAWNASTESYDTLLNNVISVLSDEALTIYDFEDVETDTIRFVGLGYSNGTGLWNSYTEFELWGWEELSAIDETSQMGEYTVYPNPSSGSFSISNSTGADIRIFDINGRLMYQQANLSADQLINPDLGQGLYFLQIQKGDFFNILRMQVR